MEQIGLEFLKFLLLALTCALIWHAFMKNYFVAVIGATLTSVIFLQIVMRMNSAQPGNYEWIATLLTFAESGIVAVLAGVPFWLRRIAKANQGKEGDVIN